MTKRVRLSDKLRPAPGTTRLVGVNEDGRRVGESHHNATIPDAVVRRIFQLRDDGQGYGTIAKQLNLSRDTVAKIARCERRAQFPRSWRRVRVHDDQEDPQEGATKEGDDEAQGDA